MRKFHPDFVTAIELRHSAKPIGQGSDSNRTHEEHVIETARRRETSRKHCLRTNRLKRLVL